MRTTIRLTMTTFERSGKPGKVPNHWGAFFSGRIWSGEADNADLDKRMPDLNREIRKYDGGFVKPVVCDRRKELSDFAWIP
ncbi:MAG: hypothetical protein LKI80_13540 [Sporolactobacillus sp.]|nr:hypothetical protein [Sporolactobacillus sp.]